MVVLAGEKKFERFLQSGFLSIHHDQNYYHRFSCGCDTYRVRRICRRQSVLR